MRFSSNIKCMGAIRSFARLQTKKYFTYGTLIKTHLSFYKCNTMFFCLATSTVTTGKWNITNSRRCLFSQVFILFTQRVLRLLPPTDTLRAAPVPITLLSALYLLIQWCCELTISRAFQTSLHAQLPIAHNASSSYQIIKFGSNLSDFSERSRQRGEQMIKNGTLLCQHPVNDHQVSFLSATAKISHLIQSIIFRFQCQLEIYQAL